jgi:hypothetical protein
MKKILTIITAALLSSTLNAQTPVTTGNFIIDPYAGVPNWANSLFYNQYDGTNTSVRNYKVNGSMLSYGGRFEYMVAENMGIGVDVNYEVSGMNYDYDSTVYNTVTTNYDLIPYNYDYTAKKTRVMARLNYHFVQNDRVDVYAGFAGGYKYAKRTATATNLNTNQSSDAELKGALVPVAFRISIGTRVYFTNNIGAMIELGAFGGGLLQFGLTAKF